MVHRIKMLQSKILYKELTVREKLMCNDKCQRDTGLNKMLIFKVKTMSDLPL